MSHCSENPETGFSLTFFPKKVKLTIAREIISDILLGVTSGIRTSNRSR